MKLSFKGRLIFASIAFIVMFVGAILFNTSIKASLILGVILFVFAFIGSSPSFNEWNKENVERRKHEQSIKRKAYLDELGRERARDQFRNERREGREPYRTGIAEEGGLGQASRDLDKVWDKGVKNINRKMRNFKL